MKHIQYIEYSGDDVVRDNIIKLDDNNIQLGDYPYYLMKRNSNDEIFFEFKYLDSSDLIELAIKNVRIGIGENSGRIYYVNRIDRIQSNGKDKWEALINYLSKDNRFKTFFSSLKDYIKIISCAEKNGK